MSSVISICRVSIGRVHRLSKPLVRSVSSRATERDSLLRRVYAPFEQLDRHSIEYEQLARSGKVWEEYFQPGDSDRYRYIDLQQRHSWALREIDLLKRSIKLPTRALVENLVAEYAHQSVQIENNRLDLGYSIRITEHLADTLFQEVDLGSMPASELAKSKLSDVMPLFPNADANQVMELRNQVVASQWVTQTALRKAGTAGLTEDELKHLLTITIKETNSEDIYRKGWGKRVAPGGYRQTPIRIRSNPLRIFPYHIEVPALMQRFFQWRDKAIKRGMHPLILACQALVYFVHIHPFPDGNGRVSRLMMQDYMIRHGYIPVTLQGIDREDYIRMIRNAQDGDPGEFVEKIVLTQLDAMITFRLREN